MLNMLKLAGKVAMPTLLQDPRNFWIGCVGIRKDGVIVSGKNGAVHSTQVDNYQLLPEAHAEGRVLRKLGKHGVLYVTRIAKANGNFAMARPCRMCRTRIKSFGVEKVFYTIDHTHYGVWFPNSNQDKIFDM